MNDFPVNILSIATTVALYCPWPSPWPWDFPIPPIWV